MKPKPIHPKKRKFLTDRLFIFSAGVSIIFFIIICQFYKLQIIEHNIYAEELRATVQKEVEIPAIRGVIYDRYGKPLATNKAVYVLKYDPQVTLEEEKRDRILLNVAKLLEENGDAYIDNMPISKTTPFVFTEDTQGIRRFITNYVPYNNNDHKEIIYGYSAPELIAYLRGDKVFDIDESFSDEEARKIIAMRLEIRQTTYQRYKQVTIAQNVSMKSLAAIAENQNEFASIISEVESQRYYTYGKAFGNLLGYTRQITEGQYQDLQSEGYEQDDIVGQVGVESQMESELRGQKGSKVIQVDNVGRTVFVLKSQEATAGNDVYLTVDANLQVETYNALEKRLSEAIVARLKGNSKTTPLTGREILISMAKNNQLDLKVMSAADEKQTQRQLYNKVLASYQEEETRLEEAEQHLPEEERTQLTLKKHFANMLDSEEVLITDRELLLAFGEQGSLRLSEEQMNSIKNGNYNLNSLLIGQLESGGLKPDQTDITPSSGTAVVVDPNTGQTLALVSYPSYDNNEFTQNFNSIYTKLHDGVDNRNIEINRALKTAKAPGSTFKMITGIAGLEEEVITPETLIDDTGQYTKAGSPYLNCWIYTNTGHGHGKKHIIGALEVSCNYYFNEVAYRLGQKFGAPYGGIHMLSSYAEMFGLGVRTGIELEETAPNISNPTNSVTTQASRALNGIRNLKEEKKEALYNNILEYLSLGFYTLGNKNATTLEGQIDYLSRPYIKKSIDTDLGIALSDNLRTIYDKILDDFNEELADGVSKAAKSISETVMSGDTSLSLKYRTKQALLMFLKDLVQPGTHKTIQKTLDKIPNGVLENAFLEGYKATLSEYEQDENMKSVCAELRRRISALEEGTFDYDTIMIDKVLDRIINVYLDETFQDVEMEWTTSLNIHTAIGQGKNAFTPVQLARYTAALANGQYVYDLTIINGIKDHKESGQYRSKELTVFNTLDLKPSTIETIHKGMLAVTTGASGTATKDFKEFPIQVALKTGTAQESNYENSWVNSFAPYEKPEIAVVTSMYGTDGLGSYTTLFTRDIYEIYFKLNEDSEHTTLDNQFIE